MMWLVAEAPGGTGLILPMRTAAGYSWASVKADESGTWQLTGTWGTSYASVYSRTRTALGNHGFKMVPVRPLEDSVPDVISTYFDGSEGLVIRQQFTTWNGWHAPASDERPSVAHLRQLKALGVIAVGISQGLTSPRISDFQLTEVLQPGKPLFGGSLIGSRTAGTSL